MTKTGLEILLAEGDRRLKNRRAGVIANPSSVGRSFEHIVDLLHSLCKGRLAAVFGPQHGARGETQDNMIEWEDYRDARTGLPVYSLYGKTRKPSADALKDLDALIFDVPDVGSRYYTFIYTMALAMEACRENEKTMIVLDRPNPINGVDIDGPVLDPEFRSFVGLFPLPIRHAMTVGELAQYFNRACGIGCQLEVVKMERWARPMFFDETGIPWVMPSPNMPTLDTALVYPGMCLFEGTNVSEGRGTTRPFELNGAPWVNPGDLIHLLDCHHLPGVIFRPAFYIPTFHKWAGQMVGGVQIHVTDRTVFKPFLTGLALLMAYRELGGDRFQWKAPPYEYEYEKLPFDILCGTDRIRRQIEAGESLQSIENGWLAETDAWKAVRQEFLLYE